MPNESAANPNNPGNRKGIRIGEILIEQGVLSEQQVFEILQAQKKRGVPFGVLAERMFDVTVESIEQAWVEQFSRVNETISLDTITADADVLKMINRRQAWQFECAPIRFEENGELLVAASRRRLARAVTFITHRIKPVVYVRLAESESLRAFLQEHYPMPEVSDELLKKARDLAHTDAA